MPSAAVRRESLGARSLLFDRRRQQLYELNDTADLIWRTFEAGGSAESAAQALQALGAPASAARGWVREAVRGWVASGVLIPLRALARTSEPPRAIRRVAVDELALDLAFHDLDPSLCDRVFGRLYAERGGGAPRLALVGCDDLVVLMRDGEGLGACARGDAPAHLKALLTEAYVEATTDGFVAHGALVSRGPAWLMLSGEPGAGKTTLAVALAAAGWGYTGDDIVRFTRGGLAQGVPFAAAVKSGAWEIAARFAPEIAALPACLRSDGQLVRYWPPAKHAERRPQALTGFVMLARQAGAGARLEAVSPVEALRTILDSAYAASRRLDAETFAGLASKLDGTRCARLVYEDLPAAVAALEAFGRVAA